MTINFKKGLSTLQKEGIEKLVDSKLVESWNDQDRANWFYATNGQSLPTKPRRTLFIDLGHSTRFPGAHGFKTEVLWNRTIWKYLETKLDSFQWNLVVVPTVYSWDWTSNINLIHRIRYINRNCEDGDWVLSIHGNSAPSWVRGVTTVYMGGSQYMLNKSYLLSHEVSRATDMPIWGGGAFDDRTARFRRVGMVRDTKPPAVLLEAGFVTNKLDMKIAPERVAEGIANFFNKL